MRRYRRLLVCLAILLSGTALIPYLSLSSERIGWQRYAGSYGPPPVEIIIEDPGFDPATLCVPPGTTVRWTNEGSVAHTVTSSDGLFDSGPLDPGESFDYYFDELGVFSYFCSIHPSKTGQVIVSTKCGAVGGATSPRTRDNILLLAALASGVALAAAGGSALLLRRRGSEERASG